MGQNVVEYSVMSMQGFNFLGWYPHTEGLRRFDRGPRKDEKYDSNLSGSKKRLPIWLMGNRIVCYYSIARTITLTRPCNVWGLVWAMIAWQCHWRLPCRAKIKSRIYFRSRGWVCRFRKDPRLCGDWNWILWAGESKQRDCRRKMSYLIPKYGHDLQHCLLSHRLHFISWFVLGRWVICVWLWSTRGHDHWQGRGSNMFRPMTVS
jgi:hypothetical protein